MLTLTEFAEQTRRIARVGPLPLMVDADHGYGNALSVMRTVAELEAAGVAALTIEDTRLPRGFGQDRDEFISEEEFAGKVRAAVAARSDRELVVLGRTGVLPTQGMDALAARVKVCEEAGADGVFFTGVRSREQVVAIHAMTRLPVVLGSTPPELHDREFLAANGVRIALQGHMPFQVAVQALQASYAHLRAGRPARGAQGAGRVPGPDEPRAGPGSIRCLDGRVSVAFRAGDRLAVYVTISNKLPGGWTMWEKGWCKIRAFTSWRISRVETGSPKG